MRLVFLDESGSLLPSHDTYKAHVVRTRRPNINPFFILAAVSIEDCHYAIIDDWFVGVKRQFLQAKAADTGPEYEIKGSLLYALRRGLVPPEWTSRRRPKYWRDQKALWDRLAPHSLRQLELAIFDLCRRVSPVIWAVVVKQGQHYRKHGSRAWPPHYLALTFIQQRVVQYMQAEYGTFRQSLLLMDETSTLSTAAQFTGFLRTRNEINATTAWPSVFRGHVLDVPVTAKSHLIQALQLADFVSHAVWKMVCRSDTLNWFGGVEPYLAKHWRTGSHLNAGLTYVG